MKSYCIHLWHTELAVQNWLIHRIKFYENIKMFFILDWFEMLKFAMQNQSCSQTVIIIVICLVLMTHTKTSFGDILHDQCTMLSFPSVYWLACKMSWGMLLQKKLFTCFQDIMIKLHWSKIFLKLIYFLIKVSHQESWLELHHHYNEHHDHKIMTNKICFFSQHSVTMTIQYIASMSHGFLTHAKSVKNILSALVCIIFH